MARFICQVRVLRNGFWRTIPSTDLVPGDIYEISDPHLTIFPCDALLLTGDAIVNESMLTGESVPVSKLPCTRNEVLHLLSLTTTISPELAKHFLFSGTKIVRVRRGTEKDAGAAIAMVVRTGFNTTKGSLVRSMLFPRPNKFRFYRDSFRFIGVMAIIAGLGFCISIVNFIKLGVLPPQPPSPTFDYSDLYVCADALAFHYCPRVGFNYDHRPSSVASDSNHRHLLRPLPSPQTANLLYLTQPGQHRRNSQRNVF